ncbi:MAG: CotH kinase family protein, partial [Anaerolineae bacterium]|nr:CotH kinase family protein [Anaerolineae bacterium]
GFKQLSFSSNWSDDSLLRERVTADVFRDAGVPSAHTAFYAVYVDYGEGPVYFGLYTAVEVIDDTVVETQFADDDGTVYKPEGTGATFAAGSFNEDSFDVEANGEDYSDVLALFDALHADTRLSDPAAWRAGLEAVFNVDGFLNWLAVNTLVQNWDTYGVMAHNYYLYHDPTTGLLTWIPWDNNMALSSSLGRGNTLSFDMAGVTANWPLIRYLIDDEVYQAAYQEHLAAALGVFAPERMTATYETLHDLIAPYVEVETDGYTLLDSQADFASSVDELVAHVNVRYAEAQAYLASEGLLTP